MAKIIHPKRWRREGNSHWVPQEKFFFPQIEPPDSLGKSRPYHERKGIARLKRHLNQDLFGKVLSQDVDYLASNERALLWDKWWLYVGEWAKLTKAYPNLVNIVSCVRLERLSRKIPRACPSYSKQTRDVLKSDPSNMDETGNNQGNIEKMKKILKPLMVAMLEKRLLAKLREMRS